MNGSTPVVVSPVKGLIKYLRRVLSHVEGWSFVEPFTPTLNMDGVHWGDDMGIVEVTQNVAASTSASVTMQVPANESWLVLFASVRITQVPTGQATPGQCRLTLRMDGKSIQVSEPVTGSTRVGVAAAWQPPYPVLLHPADAIIGAVFNGHTAALDSVVQVLCRRILTQSN